MVSFVFFNFFTVTYHRNLCNPYKEEGFSSPGRMKLIGVMYKGAVRTSQRIKCLFPSPVGECCRGKYFPFGVFLTVHHSVDFFQVANLMHTSFIL